MWHELDVDGIGPWQHIIAWNKKSMAIGMHEEEGRRLVKQLAVKTNVTPENFKLGALEKWILGPAALGCKVAARCMINLMEEILLEYDYKGKIRCLSGSSVTGIMPTNAYPCAPAPEAPTVLNADSIYNWLIRGVYPTSLLGDFIHPPPLLMVILKLALLLANLKSIACLTLHGLIMLMHECLRLVQLLHCPMPTLIITSSRGPLFPATSTFIATKMVYWSSAIISSATDTLRSYRTDLMLCIAHCAELYRTRNTWSLLRMSTARIETCCITPLLMSNQYAITASLVTYPLLNHVQPPVNAAHATDREYVSGIAHIIHLQRNNVYVDLISSTTPSAMLPIVNFWSTAPMCFLTENAVYILYP
ncbi:hypothetical protein V8D89_012370 [Ganoderma adspersum]